MNIDQIQQEFERDGFCRVRGFFSATEIQDLRREVDAYIQTHLKSLPEGDYVLEADGKSVRNLWRMEQHEPRFTEFALQPRLTELVGRLVHGKPILMAMETFNKPAKVGSAVPYHQDNAYFCQTPPDVLTVWIAIDPASAANGGIYYVPESHREGVHPHKKSGVRGNSMGLSDPPDPATTHEFCGTLSPGDILIHHSQTIHRSEPNRSDQSRLACLLVFRGAHTRDDASLKARYQLASQT